MLEIEIAQNTFDSIKHIDEDGNEYWLARELQQALTYKEWRKFNNVINKAKIACNSSQSPVESNFVRADKMIYTGLTAKRLVQDYKLSRYACYLIAQNGDSRMRIIALAQTYFAVQTRKQEILEKNFADLSEDDKRLVQRSKTKILNHSLNNTAKKAGVKNFDKFHNSGYMGLYNGETANDIAKRKGLRYREDILDNMGNEELAANIFRIAQAEAKMKREAITGEKNANDAHYVVGKAVRDTIASLGGTMPEDLPTPEKSIKELEKEKTRKITYKNEDQ